MKTPYPHQRKAVDSVYNYWPQKDSGNGLIVIPTGGGKSLIMAILCKEISEKWPGTRILILAHDKRLVKQNFKEMKEEWPEAPCGIYCAGLGRKDINAPILFATIQSIAKNVHKLYPAPEIVFIDEAQLIPREENTLYMKTISTMKIMYPSLRLLGITATHYRMDSGYLNEGEGAIFDDVIYEAYVQDLIDEGFLAPVRSEGGAVKIDTAGLHHSKGEFIQGEVESRILESDINRKIVDDVISRSKDRKKWLFFVTGTKHAKEVRDLLNEKGITAEMVVSENDAKTNDRYLEEFSSGQIKCLITIVMLTVGFNERSIDLLIDASPTESPGRHVQKIGRGMRVFLGKIDCLLLDYAGNCIRHGPIDSIHPKKPGEGGGAPPSKECPDCMAIIAAGCLICPVCGHKFPEPKPVIYSAPVEAPVLKSQIQPRELEVFGVKYEVHQKEGSANSVKIEYMCGIMWVKEWIFPEAGSDRALYFFRKFMAEAGATRTYRTAQEVEDDPPPCPTKIWVIKDGRFDRVVKREYAHGN